MHGCYLVHVNLVAYAAFPFYGELLYHAQPEGLPTDEAAFPKVTTHPLTD